MTDTTSHPDGDTASAFDRDEWRDCVTTAANRLARNPVIGWVETDGPHGFTDDCRRSQACRVHLRGVYRDADVTDWLAMDLPDLGVTTVPDDTFETWGDDDRVTYVTITEREGGVAPDAD